MKISEVIEKLQEIQNESGDLPVYVSQIDDDGDAYSTIVKRIDTPVKEDAPYCARLCDFID